MQRTFVNPTPKADGKKFADLEITSLDTPSAEPDAIPATLGAWLKEETMNSALGQPPTQIPTGVFLRRIHINIERKRKIRLQHSMLRAAKSGHVVSLHNCYRQLDEPTNCNDSKWSCRYSVGSRNPFR
jgi:hypothetical protein